MIDLYTWSTPNGAKATIALEEMGLDYKIHLINIGKDEQFAPEFLKISPNNKIPAIVDQDNGLSLMESGAIMVYLAEKTNSFIGNSAEERANVMQWLMWQMGGFGPMLGQAAHFIAFNPGKSDYAEERYRNEAKRLYEVLDKQLSENAYVAGDYSIADMAIWPWVAGHSHIKFDLNDFPHVKAWYLTLAERPGVQAGFKALFDRDIPKP